MIKKTNKPKVTLETIQQSIESLAGSTAGGFVELRAEMNERFDEVDKRFDLIETDLTGLRQRVNSIDNRLDNFVDHERRLVKIEKVLKVGV